MNSPKTPSFFCQLAWGFRTGGGGHEQERESSGLNDPPPAVTNLRCKSDLAHNGRRPHMHIRKSRRKKKDQTHRV